MTANPVEGVQRLIEDSDFRASVGRFATGVTVVTTKHAGRDWGATVSAFASVSNDPPSVLVCLNRSSDTCAAVQATGRLVVNVMADAQAEVAMKFAGKCPDKFAEVELERTDQDLPVIADSHVSMACRVVDSLDFGTHTIYVGEVDYIAPHAESQPLTYHGGAFGLFTAPPVPTKGSAGSASAQMAAYATWFGHHDLW